MSNKDPILDHGDTSDLGARTMRGGVSTLISSLVRIVLMLASVLVLARLLTPEDYGIISLVFPLVIFVTMVGDLGLTTATMQREKLSHAQTNTMFWLGLLFGAGMWGVSAALAPVAVWFYDEPRVEAVMIALGFGFVLNALKAQHESLLMRELRLLTLAFNEIVAAAVALAVGIAVALNGGDYWALVAMPLMQNAVAALFAWATVNWRPGWPAWSADMGGIMHFGLYLTGFKLLNYVARNLDNILIGWRWGAVQLGPYAMAYRLITLPLETFHLPLTNVAVPALSRLRNESARFERYYLTSVSTLSFILCPLIAGAGLAGDLLIPLVLGQQWQPAAPIFSLLCLVGALQTVTYTHGWLFAATGRTDRQFWLRVCTLPITTAGFVLGLPYGAFGVALGYTISVLVVVLPSVWFSLKGTPVRLGAFARALFPTALVTSAVLIAIQAVRFAVPADTRPAMELFYCVGVSAIAFFATAYWVFGAEVSRTRLDELRKMMSRKAAVVPD